MYIYIVILIAICFLGIVIKPDKNKKRKKLYIFIVFGMLTIIAALRKYTIGIDLQYIYKPAFDKIVRNAMGGFN